MVNNYPPAGGSKYEIDLKELDLLKEKAKITKNKGITPVVFFRLLLTLTLLITLFAIAFGIAYRKTASDIGAEVIKYTPEAKIVIPTNTP